jgi:serine/threonine-protein kinase
MTGPVQPGEVLAGKYKVERVLGVGGMGVVVAALHLELDERVAIKFMLEEALANEEAVERFAREARAAVRIKSEHVARVTDVGKLENGAPYMVMEYLEGVDLAGLLEKQQFIPVEEAVGYVLQACEAIAEAHAIGIVHRDLKPGNLFLADRSDGTRAIKVLDFGISKASGRGSRPEMSLTKTTTVMGSPFYMSPEQMRASKNADMRSDIWALGIILHELISGKAVFDAGTMPELCARILADDPEPLSQARPGVSPGIEAVVRRCLEKSPDKRYQTIGELASALMEFGPKSSLASVERIRRVLDKAGIVSGSADAGSRANGGESPRAAQAATMASWGTARIPAAKSSPRAIVIGFCAALAIGGAATFFVVRGRGPAAVPVGVTTLPSSAPLPVAERTPEPKPTVTAAASAEPEVSMGPQAAPNPGAPASPLVSPAASASAAVTSAQPVASGAARPPTGKPGAVPVAKPVVTAKPATKKSDLFSDPK